MSFLVPLLMLCIYSSKKCSCFLYEISRRERAGPPTTAVCGTTTVSQLMRSRPSPTSSATPTPGDDSIPSVSYRLECTVSLLMRSRPSPTSSATPTPCIKSDDSIHSVSCHAVCEPWSTLSQLTRSRPSTTSSATPTPGIKSDDSIHSVSYRAVCEPWSTLSQLTRSRPSTTSSTTPTPGIKSDDSIRYIPYPTSLSVSLGKYGTVQRLS